MKYKVTRKTEIVNEARPMFEIFDSNPTNISVQSAYLITKLLSQKIRLSNSDDSVQRVSQTILESIEEVEGKKIESLSIERSNHYIIEIEKHIAAMIRSRSKIDKERGHRLLQELHEIALGKQE